MRALAGGRPPVSLLAVGPAVATSEIVAAARASLNPAEVIVLWGDDHEAEMALTSRHGEGRHYRLVIWHEPPDPTPALLAAVVGLTTMRGTWLVATATEPLAEIWTEAFRLHVNCRLSARERMTWAQQRMGGTTSDAAVMLWQRTGQDMILARSELEALSIVTDRATVGDVEQLVPGDAGRDFAAALIGCRKAEALASIPRIDRPAFIIGSLEYRLLLLWTLLETRPAVGGRTMRDLEGALSIPRFMLDELVPLVNLYSRQKVRSRLEALALTDGELRRGTTTGAFEVLVSLW